MKRLYLQLSEPGAGEISVPLDSAMAANITDGVFIELKCLGVVLGGFYAEDTDRNYVDHSENAGRLLRASGRGPLSILDDAIVWDWGTTSENETTRFFKTVIGGNQFTTPMHHKGEILNQLLHESMELRTNPSLNVMDRKCFHDPLDNHILAWVFDDNVDSDAVAWDAAENVDIQMREGTTLLDVARLFCALGQPTPGLTFEMGATRDAITGITTVAVHQTPIGVSQANTNVHFRAGHNCLVVSDQTRSGDIRNACMVYFSNPDYPWAVAYEPASIIAHRRRELFLETANASDTVTGGRFGAQILAQLKEPRRTIVVKVSDAVGPKYGVDYGLGDWIYYDAGGVGVETLYRIRGIQLEWDDDWFTSVLVELESS